MNNCPNCGNKIVADQAVCDCGELLRAEVTHHSHSWETETIFRAKKRFKENYLATASVVLVVVATILALAWPRIRENSQKNIVRISADSMATQTDHSSDVTSDSDLIRSDSTNESPTQEGVFDFTAGRETSRTIKSKYIVRAADVDIEKPQTAVVMEKSVDDQLPNDKAEQRAKPNDEKALSDCKPAITASLKKPEPGPENSDLKPQAKQNAINYVLGPRGGCFFVTSGGSKKYVDRSLCGSSNVSAARQD